MKNISVPEDSMAGAQHQQPVLETSESFRERRRSHDRRVVQTYEAESRRDFNPTEKTKYLNIGYWKDGARTLDEAGQAMANLVGEAGGFSPGDSVLDAGCGFGDPAIFWVERFGVQRIVGIDINSSEIEVARKRIADLSLADRIDLRVASATEVPFEDESFDKVVALEAAHHFLTREDFFREAYRVLRSGGRLVTTDVVPLPGRTVRAFLNPLNAYSAQVYVGKLAEAGFVNVTVSSIRDHVFRPYSSFILRRLRLTNVRGLLNVAIHKFLSSRLDYILVTADKRSD